MSDERPARRVATVTLSMDEESYLWFMDFLVRSLPYSDYTPETHPILIQMRENITYKTLVQFPTGKQGRQ